MNKVNVLLTLIFLGGFKTDAAGIRKADLFPDLRSPAVQSTGGRDFKTGALNKEEIISRAVSLAVPFVQNVGQFDARVKYAADLFSGRFFLTGKELVYSLSKPSDGKVAQQDKHKRSMKPESNIPGKGLVFREFFIDKKGVKIGFKSVGEQKAETVISYFKGNDTGKWRSGVASYQSVSLGQVYPGVEVKLKASGKNVEKVFYVSPQSDVTGIRIGVSGVKGLRIAEDGRLIFKNSLGELAMRAPVAWQEIAGQRHDVKVDYRLLGKNFYGFAVSEGYDKGHLLIIDPDLDTLMASTFLGGGGWSRANSLALGSDGNVYLTGYAWSDIFPTTPGAYDRSATGGPSVFVSKLNSSLTVLLASTYLDGGVWEYGNSLAIDNSGNVYLTGWTESADFPTTPGAYDNTYNPGIYNGYSGDVFISKLNSELTILLASTFLGGSVYDFGKSLALDSAGNVYLTGYTNSDDFPTTAGAYDRCFNDAGYAYDIFISKLNSGLTKLLASTYLGGCNADYGQSMVLDDSGNICLAGYTKSLDFPSTAGAYDRSYNGNWDVFVSKLNGGLTALLASTYLGGSKGERGNSLVLDGSGNVYLTGYTHSPADFPTTIGAYDQVAHGSHDVFVSKMNNSLSKLLASTLLGGSNDDEGDSLTLDSFGNVYLTGWTYSADFPTTGGAFERSFNGYSTDVIISKLSDDLTKLLASTFLGGNYYDYGRSLALDSAGSVYLTGETRSQDFPVTPKAYDHSYKTIFISKLRNKSGSLKSITLTSPNGGEIWTGNTDCTITWKSSGTIDEVRIEVSTDNGTAWGDVVVATANDGSYAWTVPNTPSPQCLVRISDAGNPAVKDTSNTVFSIIMDPSLLSLQVERREARAFSIVHQYGQIQFLFGTTSVPVARFSILRREGSGDFVSIRTIATSELQNNQFQMLDKYLQKDTSYTYRVEAYDTSGRLLGVSAEKNI